MSDRKSVFFQKEYFFDNGTVIFFSCEATSDFPLLTVSNNVEKILGFKPAYFLEHEHGWSDRIHPDDKENVFQSFQQLLTNKKGVINEYRFCRKDGKYIWLRDEISLVYGDKKGDSIICGSSFDITKRREAELNLKQSKQKYESIVAHIKDVIYSLDAEGRLTFLNKAWEEKTGYPREESYGKLLTTFIHPEDRSECDEIINRFAGEEIKDGKDITKVIRLLKKNGDLFWAELYAKRVSEKGDGQHVFSGTLIDISKDIAHQQEIEAVNKELERRVEQRSDELEQEIERRKAAEQQLKNRLEYELAISRCSSLLLRSTSDETLRKSLEILLEVTKTDRVYLYKNRKENGTLFLEPIMEVCADGIDSSMEKIDGNIKYSEVPWWRDQLFEKNIIHSVVDDIPEPEKKILIGQNAKSILAITIYINNEWFGYIGFTDTQNKRIWDETIISFLKTVSGMIAGFEKRRMIESSLVQQRNYTETILDSLPSIYLLMNKDLRLVQWNKNAEEYTEYSQDELKTKSAFDLIVSDQQEELRKATQRVIENRASGTELSLLTKAGHSIPYFWRGYHIQLNGEQHFLCVGIDITDQKEAERKLMDEKRFNEALIESMPGIFYMIDKEGNYHRWNKNFMEQLGYKSEEINQMSFADLFVADNFEGVKKEIEKVFEDGESELEARILTKEEKRIPYFLTGKLFIQDNVEYLVGVGHDISEQIEARERLKKSEEMFRNLFLKAPAAIVMVGPDNRVQNINDSFKKLFGYSEEEIRGKDIDSVIVPEDQYEKAPKMPTKNYAMNSFHKEAKRLTKDGDLIDVFVAAIPVFVDEKPLAGFGMYIDITEQKKYEQEIYSSLREKHVLLQEIHHRVKNNLAVVSGLIQLQIYETDDPIIRETLQESESRIQTMALIHEKLYQSKNLSRISCETYIGDLVETIRNTVSSEKNISVVTEIEDVKLNINQAVPFALLVNEAVTNSFKHAFEGHNEGNITIQIDKKDDRINACLSDDGIGLPVDFSPEDQDSLGITLIQNFMHQLDADWEIGSEDGTYINLTFKLDDIKGSSASGLLD
ncbi:MAG: PAS domain S-box protein [Balneolaceae bacterium]